VYLIQGGLRSNSQFVLFAQFDLNVPLVQRQTQRVLEEFDKLFRKDCLDLMVLCDGVVATEWAFEAQTGFGSFLFAFEMGVVYLVPARGTVLWHGVDTTVESFSRR